MDIVFLMVKYFESYIKKLYIFFNHFVSIFKRFLVLIKPLYENLKSCEEKA